MKSLQEIKENARAQMAPMAEPFAHTNAGMSRQEYVRRVGVAMLIGWLFAVLSFILLPPVVAALVSLALVVLTVSAILLVWIGRGIRENSARK